MKKFYVILIFFLFFSCDVSLYAQLPADQQKAIVLKRMIEMKHYSPRPVDDSFSLFVFKTIINTVDQKRLLFTAQEFKQLSAFKYTLDDELNGNGWAFLDLFSDLYKRSLHRADSIINRLAQKPFDFSINDTIAFSKEESFSFAADNIALSNRWAHYLKFSALNEIYDAVDDDSTKNTDFKTALVSMEASTREKIKRSKLRGLKKLLDYPAGFPVLVKEIYFNAIASAFDPHSNYFSPQEKEKFQSEMSTEAYSFGLELDENSKGQIVIERLTPGGPAWLSGELHKGDELQSLQWEGKEETNISGATLEEIYAILESSMRDKLVFKFRKTDGTIKTVTMRKEKIENEENIVKSFLLQGDKKIGYILLPGFYTEWGNESGSRCANDVAKEIVKLKKENINGLILDLRFNGGGSLGEAMEMAGIFIDEGPLAIEKHREGKLITLKDPNRGTIYDGPLVLMVNGQSASASEMLSASLQDYNRAVIVGSNTYGKATMQLLFLLDTMKNKPEAGEGREMVKITAGKLYRLNGESAQLKGVVPDVLLPDAFDALEFREKFSPNALPYDTVKKNTYYLPLPPLPVKELVQKSAVRIQNDIGFQNIKTFVDLEYKLQHEKTNFVPLRWQQFENWRQQQDAGLHIKEGMFTSGIKKFTADNHQSDKQWMMNNEYAKEVNVIWLENISKDIYIREAFMVLCDLINLQKPTIKN
jgi:carboxyl-terminal processing protease